MLKDHTVISLQDVKYDKIVVAGITLQLHHKGAFFGQILGTFPYDLRIIFTLRVVMPRLMHVVTTANVTHVRYRYIDSI